jgi:ankyrin repeat protein
VIVTKKSTIFSTNSINNVIGGIITKHFVMSENNEKIVLEEVDETEEQSFDKKKRKRDYNEEEFDGISEDEEFLDETLLNSFFESAYKGDLDGIKNGLEKGVSVYNTDKNGRTGLMYAVKSGNMECVKYLLEKNSM